MYLAASLGAFHKLGRAAPFSNTSGAAFALPLSYAARSGPASRVYSLHAKSLTMLAGMGTTMLRVLVVMLVIAAGIVARVSYEQLVDPSEPAEAQSVAASATDSRRMSDG